MWGGCVVHVCVSSTGTGRVQTGELSRLSYTRKYNSLSVDSARGLGLWL